MQRAKPDGAVRRTDVELTGRQRQVLRLIAAGKTNAEIGEALGISLDGAKWHVSEILSRLDVATREEAAEWWSLRNRGLRRLQQAMRGLFAGTVVKVAAGVGAAAVGVAIVIIVVGLKSTEERPVVPGSFHIEAIYFDRRELTGTQLQPKEEAAQGHISWWQRDSRHFLIETTDEAPSLTAYDSMILADGNWGWVQGPSSPFNYAKVPLGGSPVSLSAPFATRVGPATERTVEGLIAKLSKAGGPLPRHAEKAGEETILGRRTVIVTYGPTWSDREHGTSGGFGKIWVDPQTMLVLRRSEEGADGSEARRSEAVSIETDVAIPDSKFTWKAPPGATVVDLLTQRTGRPTDLQRGIGEMLVKAHTDPGALKLPPPFLTPSLPPDFEVGGGGGGGEGVTLELGAGSRQLLRLEEQLRFDGLPVGLQRGVEVKVGNFRAFRGTTGGSTTLAFSKDGVAVLMTAVGMSYEEMETIAASMKVVQP